MITSNIKNYKRYCINSDFKTAFDFLVERDLKSLPEGKTIINDNVYIIKDSYKTLAIGETFWESHEKYADIQYIFEGSEKFSYSPTLKLKEVIYNEENDLKILKGPIQSIVQLNKTDFAIFFPEDAHMPSLNASSESFEVTKFVVKVKLNEFF